MVTGERSYNPLKNEGIKKILFQWGDYQLQDLDSRAQLLKENLKNHQKQRFAWSVTASSAVQVGLLTVSLSSLLNRCTDALTIFTEYTNLFIITVYEMDMNIRLTDT